MIKTENGSVYRIDPEARTWERISKTDRSGYVRTRGGVFTWWSGATVGHNMTLIGEGLTMGTRIIYTSLITEIWEEHGPKKVSTRTHGGSGSF